MTDNIPTAEFIEELKIAVAEPVHSVNILQQLIIHQENSIIPIIKQGKWFSNSHTLKVSCNKVQAISIGTYLLKHNKQYYSYSLYLNKTWKITLKTVRERRIECHGTWHNQTLTLYCDYPSAELLKDSILNQTTLNYVSANITDKSSLFFSCFQINFLKNYTGKHT